MQFKTLVEAVAYWAKETPDKTCLIDAETDSRITYGEFWRQVCMFARRLREGGLDEGARVVVRVGPAIETVVAQFGIYLAGGVCCPVEKHMKPQKVMEMLEYYDSALLISSERLDFRDGYIALSDVRNSENDGCAAYALPDAQAMCDIIFTTGTTGKAKGVMLDYSSNHLFAKAWQKTFDISNTDVLMWANPLERVPGIGTYGAAFLSGGTAVHYSGIVFADFFSAIALYEVRAVFMASSQLSILIENASELFESIAGQLRLLVVYGSFVSDKIRSKATELLPTTDIYVHYGATESSIISYYKLECGVEKTNCVGKPFQYTKVYASENCDKNIGIQVESECMMLGYWKAPDLTEKAMQNGRLNMADAGYIGADGLLYLVGRKDDIIDSGGYKIAPYEIEDAAMRLEGIVECACVPAEHKILGHIPALYVVVKNGADISVKQIARHLANRLETYKIPRVIKIMDELPKVGGKIDRKALSAMSDIG